MSTPAVVAPATGPSALPPLVTVNDMADLPGGAKLSQAQLDVAASTIRNHCDWHIAPRFTETVTASGTGRPELLLPTLRPVYITSIREHDQHALGPDAVLGAPLLRWRAVRGGMLYRAEGWPKGRDNLVIDLEHGFDICPDDLRAAVLALAKSVGEIAVGVRSEAKTVGSVAKSRTYFAEGIRAGGTGLPPALSAVLDRYRLPA